MATHDYVLKEAASAATTSQSTTYANMLSMSSADGYTEGNKYIVLVVADHMEFTTAGDVGILAVDVDGTEVAKSYGTANTATQWYSDPLMYVGVHTMGASGSIDLKLKCGTGNTGDVTLVNMRIVMWDINTYTEGVDYHYASGGTAIANNDNYSGNAQTITFTPTNLEEYLILACTEFYQTTGSANSRGAAAAFTDDNGATTREAAAITTIEELDGNDAAFYVGSMWMFVGDGTSTTYDYDVRKFTGTSGFVGARRTNMLILPGSVFDFDVLVQDQSESTGSAWDTTFFAPAVTNDDAIYLAQSGPEDTAANKSQGSRIQFNGADSANVDYTNVANASMGGKWVQEKVARTLVVREYDASRDGIDIGVDWDVYQISALWRYDNIFVALYGSADAGGGGGGSTNIKREQMGDISPKTIAILASDAGVTLTSGEILGQLQEIADATGADDPTTKEKGSVRDNIISDFSMGWKHRS